MRGPSRTKPQNSDDMGCSRQRSHDVVRRRAFNKGFAVGVDMSEITELHQIDLDNGQIAKPSWSLNGRFLAVPTESGSIVIFDAGTMQIINTLGPHSGAVTTVGWNRE